MERYNTHLRVSILPKPAQQNQSITQEEKENYLLQRLPAPEFAICFAQLPAFFATSATLRFYSSDRASDDSFNFFKGLLTNSLNDDGPDNSVFTKSVCAFPIGVAAGDEI
jgi:hypothetical protein